MKVVGFLTEENDKLYDFNSIKNILKVSKTKLYLPEKWFSQIFDFNIVEVFVQLIDDLLFVSSLRIYLHQY